MKFKAGDFVVAVGIAPLHVVPSEIHDMRGSIKNFHDGAMHNESYEVCAGDTFVVIDSFDARDSNVNYLVTEMVDSHGSRVLAWWHMFDGEKTLDETTFAAFEVVK